MNLNGRFRRRLGKLGTIQDYREDESAEETAGRRATWSIAVAVGIGSMSFNFWYPFMPLYLLQIGASSQANALFWIAVATSVQGVTRLS